MTGLITGSVGPRMYEADAGIFGYRNIDPDLLSHFPIHSRIYVLDRKPVLIGCFHFLGVKNIVFTTLQQYVALWNNKRQSVCMVIFSIFYICFVWIK